MCWHWVNNVSRACEQLKRGFEVLARCEMCFEGMGAVEKVVWSVCTGGNMF